MSELLNLGNGFIVGGSRKDAVRLQGHSGLEYPEVEVRGHENAVTDGGSVGRSRVARRRITLLLSFRDATRSEIAQAFSPGIERVLTTPQGRYMPYIVERFSFASENLTTRPVVCSVTILSSFAYPVGATQGLACQDFWQKGPFSAGAAEFAVDDLPEFDGKSWAWYDLTLPLDGYIGSPSCQIHAPQACTVDLYLAPMVDGLPDFGNVLRHTTVSTGGNTPSSDYYLELRSPVVTPAEAGSYAIVMAFPRGVGITIPKDAAAPDADHLGGSRLADGSFALGDGVDSSIDWSGQYAYVGQPGATVTNVEVDPLSDVVCDPLVTVVCNGTSASLQLTFRDIFGNVKVFKLNGSFVANDVVVVDSAAHTVTVNGVNRLSWLDTTRDWPTLFGRYTRVSPAPAVKSLAISWQPRYLGLL